MKKFLSVSILLFAAAAQAQTANPVTVTPATITPPSAPIAPAAPDMTPVTSAQPAQTDMMSQLQGILGKKGGSQQNLGQVVVIGSLLGCTQKTAGKEATDAFYQQMQAVGKTVEGYCKQGNAAQARALILSTVNQNQNSPVVKSALTCYDQQAANISAMGGQRMATDAANYARWMRNPGLAEKELKESDVCRNMKPAAAPATTQPLAQPQQ